MILRVEHAEAEALEGFGFFWCMTLLRGFRPEHHCLKCLVGVRDRLVHPMMAMGEHVVPDGITYVCGVERRNTYALNFHMAVAPASGSVEGETFNGYKVTIDGARRLDIPELPDGWNGLPIGFTRCRNYRFGVAHLAAPRAGGVGELGRSAG